MDIYLIRHTRVATPPGICYGRTDVPLADSYPADEAAVRARLAPVLAAPHRAVASPLTRCRRLATALVSGEIGLDDRLMEYDFGRWELRAWDALPAAEVDPWMADFVHVAAPGGESFAAMQARAVAFLAENLAGEEPLLVFAHSAIIRGLLCHCLGLPLESAFRLDIDYGSVSKVRYSGGHFNVAFTNSL